MSDVTSAAYSPQFLIRFDFAKAQQRLRRVASLAQRDAVRQFAAQQDNAAMSAPTMQAQTGLLALPSLTSIYQSLWRIARTRSRFTFAVMRRRNR